jgi:aspartyl-tRNA(Asn)/glutamyl-tRNA(Gln) amidotransferase subunit A
MIPSCLPLRTIIEQLQSRDLTSVALVESCYAQIEKLEPQLHAFNSFLPKDQALKLAQVADQQRTKDSPPLFGVPYTLKDAYCTTELPTTSGSAMLKDFVPPYDATVHRLLKEAGAILIGKNSQDAWGHGGSSENTDFTPPKNPWDQSRISGGSSGGCAVAVSTGMTVFAIGEDTGGSIRNPASMCNVNGLKVTYGRVSRWGAIAYASSLDTVGPMGRSAEDLAIILEAIAGRDNRDATSSHKPTEQYTAGLTESLKGKKIGWPSEFYGRALDPRIENTLLAARIIFEKLGAEIVDVSIPSMKHSVPIYYLIAMSETSSNLARYDGIRFGQDRSHFTEESMRRVIGGTYALSSGYADKLYRNAQKARTQLIAEYNQVFEKCDVLIAPVTPNPASKIGELVNDPMLNLLEDLYTVSVNVVGVPSLALPVGFTQEGTPIGMQLIGKKFHEQEILHFGAAYQANTSFHQKLPPIATS